MKGYSIYRDNTVIYEFVVDDTISKSLSGNKYVSFTISSKNDLDLKIGDYVLVGNEKYEIFGPIDIEESNGVFTYPLTFYFQGYKLNNSIITDEGATTFAYHGEVSDFMTLLIDSLNEDYPEFTLGTIQNGSILDLSFDNSNCMAALQTVCENAEMEWDITGTVITVKRRIGEETDYVFEYGKNKGSYSVKLAKVANASVTTRMIGKGGTLNLPADYDSPDSPKRLNLGDEVIEKNVEKYGKITGVYVNENIYPRLINKTVLGVTVPENIEEAGSWKIKLDIPFNLSEYYAENEIPVVKFQTGDLTGLNFEIVENSWNNTDKTLSIIVKEEEDGYYLPNANRQPRVGDVFVLLNINMPQSYIDEATQELREATQNELNKKCEPQYAPSLSVQKHYIKKKGISLNIGDGITVKIGRRNITTRIIGTTETSDDIRVELGDQMLYTYDTKVNNTIEQIQFTLKQLINIDDIKRLFYNLINAWYPKWFNQKLHKDADVEFNSVKAAELVQSDNFSSKNFTSGALGSGHRIKDGNAEFQNLTVRGQFSVFEFLIQQVKAIGGKFCVSPAAIKTGSVEETENGYKCFFNTDSGTIINPFVVGDQAFHQVFDGQKMKRYWRLVTEVGADYFVLSKTDCEANSGIPEADEEIVLLGNRTDINRQSAIMISAHDNNSPYIAFYARINSYSFEGKEPMRTGNLNGIVDEDFGQLTGFGLYCQNVYMKGVFRLMSGKTVEESIGDVQSNLDNLQVGETNLLDNSNKGWKNTGYPIATIYLGDYKPKQGEECTIVIKGKLGANKTSWGVYNSGGNVVLASFYPGGPDTDYIALKTFKWTLTPAIDNTFIRIYPMPNSVSVESEIEWVKLVLGNKTSLLWTPSINDQRQIAIDEAGKVVDGIQIGSQNLISKKMMLKWNEKNKNIAVWGQDADGVYLRINEGLLHKNWAGSNEIANPVFDLQFKPDTQYVLSVEWKLAAVQNYDGLAFRIFYTDGTAEWHGLAGTIITKTIARLITKAGKTVQKISASYGSNKANTLIYNISLIEGNKPLQGFPVAEEDQTGANNVNLADGTKEFTIGVGSTNYTYKELYVSKIKPNTVYYVNAQNIEVLSGNADKCDFILYDKAIKNYLTTTYHHLYDKNGGILITKNDFEAQEGYLLCYAGESGHTKGNSVRFTEVMLVEGFLPAPVWTPSFSEQQAEIKTITETLTEIKAENGEISLKVSEVSTRVETAKQEAINTAAADATSKANAAKDEAKNYTDSVTDSMWKGWIDASKLDESKYYPVVMQIKRGRRARIELNVALDSGTKPSWSTHDLGFTVRCIWESSADEWGTASINRIIEDYHYRYSNVIPAGDINQMTHSSNEYIYVRGGGKYYFAATNLTSEPSLKTSAFTVSNQTIDVRTSVTEPSITNATKEELNAEINITKGLIENKVSLDVYNENDQLIKSDISNLQVSYNQISSTVSKIINGTQEISGVVTQSNFVTIFSSNKNALGQEVIESINVGGGGVTIDASRINLNGAISANGNVQITTDGKLIAVNGEFTGKITATEGEIAGLKLSNNGLRSSDFNAISKIGSCYAKNGFSVYASGTGVLTPSTGGMQAGIITAVGDFISHITGLEIIAKETSYDYGSSSKVTALRIEAANRYSGTPFDPPLAIEVVSGDVLFGGKMTVNNTSIFRGQIYLNLNNIPNISGASNYYLCIDRSTGQLSYR
ncbi:hypothetical protein [Odoribacter splanchnicus]|uniref:hypothetical protein n=1 Tax=Odoribacter splanchnicus TaxID=28118 RepID=UPI000E4E57D8|nr:hypothetical protein [Odoribacter splanchnicus]RHA39451.1 hypothetical protein DW936_15135 [Odoribacter splanchnicus]